jgi:chromosome segregation ATPase
MNVDHIVRALQDTANLRSMSASRRDFLIEVAKLIESLEAQLKDATDRNKRLSEDYSAYSGSALERADGLIENMEKEIKGLQAQIAESQRRKRAADRDMRKLAYQLCERGCWACEKNNGGERCRTTCNGFKWRGPQDNLS